MTYVAQFSCFSSPASSETFREYQVEIVTFDGDSFFESIVAASEEEAAEMAASMFDNTDFVMIQGVVA